MVAVKIKTTFKKLYDVNVINETAPIINNECVK